MLLRFFGFFLDIDLVRIQTLNHPHAVHPVYIYVPMLDDPYGFRISFFSIGFRTSRE